MNAAVPVIVDVTCCMEAENVTVADTEAFYCAIPDKLHEILYIMQSVHELLDNDTLDTFVMLEIIYFERRKLHARCSERDD